MIFHPALDFFSNKKAKTSIDESYCISFKLNTLSLLRTICNTPTVFFDSCCISLNHILWSEYILDTQEVMY